MRKARYKLLDDFKESLQNHSSESIFAFVEDLASKGQTIKDLCEHTLGARSEKISRFEAIRNGINRYLIDLIKKNDLVTLRRWRKLISTDFVGDVAYFNILTEVLNYLVSLENSPETLANIFHQFLLRKFAVHERQPFQEALIESIGPEPWIEMEAHTLTNLDNNRISQELSFLTRKHLLESFLSYLVRNIEHKKLETNKIVKFNQIIELTINQPNLREILQPFLIVFYAYGSFNGEYSESVKQSIQEKIFGDRKELLMREFARFEEYQLSLPRELSEIKDELESKKWGYIAEQELDKEYRRKMKLFEDKTIKFYEKWRDEEIAKILRKLLEMCLVGEDILEGFNQKEMKTAKENSHIEKVRGINNFINDIFHEYNAELIGKPGDLVQYDSLKHGTYTRELRNGEVVRIVKPGLLILHNRGEIKYVIEKALVAQREG